MRDGITCTYMYTNVLTKLSSSNVHGLAVNSKTWPSEVSIKWTTQPPAPQQRFEIRIYRMIFWKVRKKGRNIAFLHFSAVHRKDSPPAAFGVDIRMFQDAVSVNIFNSSFTRTGSSGSHSTSLATGIRMILKRGTLRIRQSNFTDLRSERGSAISVSSEVWVMRLVRITLWYPKFNGSHFGLPPSSVHRMTGLGGKFVGTMTYSHRPHFLSWILLGKAASRVPTTG